MSARTRKRHVQRLMWGDSRRCPIGLHAYVMEQNAWIEDGSPHFETRWKCWTCCHWQTSPPIGTLYHFVRQHRAEIGAANNQGSGEECS